MRRIVAMLGAVLCALPHAALAGDLRTQRQKDVQFILLRLPADSAALLRSSCLGADPAILGGRRAILDATASSLSLTTAEICVTVLTRLGRDGALAYVHDTRSQKATSAEAFDTGFVTAYHKHEPVTADLPGIAAMKPLAERCLAQAEPNTALCSAAGYALGARAASGETVAAQ